eukprot:9632004-Lingulodinium_polyedra.AAC.1
MGDRAWLLVREVQEEAGLLEDHAGETVHPLSGLLQLVCPGGHRRSVLLAGSAAGKWAARGLPLPGRQQL